MKKISLVVVISILNLFAFHSNAQSNLMVEDSYEPAAGRLFNEEEYLTGNSVLNQFENVIVINKAASGTTAQTLRLYTNGQFVLTTDVSTGAETVEVVKKINAVFKKLFNKKGALESHWRHTTRGFFTVKRVEGAGYTSGESKFHMPYAMFFNDIHGLAVHQVPPDLSSGEAAGEAALGSRASSGCVRVHKNVIQSIHTAVVNAGRGAIPAIDTKTGLQLTNPDGTPKMTTGFKSIVIVEEVKD